MNQQPVQGEVSSIRKWCEERKRTEKHCKWLIQLKGIHLKVLRNSPGSKNPSGEVAGHEWFWIVDIISNKSSFVQLEVNPPAPVDPHIQYPSALMPSYVQIFGPAQGSSCRSVCMDPRQHNHIPGVVWLVRYKVVWGCPPQHAWLKYCL